MPVPNNHTAAGTGIALGIPAEMMPPVTTAGLGDFHVMRNCGLQFDAGQSKYQVFGTLEAGSPDHSTADDVNKACRV